MLSHCAALARRFDPERALCARMAPRDAREALFAILALNAEIARIRELVREPMAGRLRLQWWFDALDPIFLGAPPRHPAAEAFSDAVRVHGLPKAPLERLLEARLFDMDDAAFADLEEMEAYAEATSASLILLSLKVLGADGEDALEAARRVGIAWALIGLCRAVPFHASLGRSYMPLSLCPDQDLRSGEPLSRCVRDIAAAARAHLDEARRLRPRTPWRGRAALLHASLGDGHLDRLEAAGFDPHRASLAPPGGATAGLAIRSWLGRY